MLTRLRLTNFKSFREASVSFQPVSLVLGANGAGKSNLFDALRLLKSVGEGRSIRDAIEGHASYGPSDTVVSGIRGGGADITHFKSDYREFSLVADMRVGSDRLKYSLSIDADQYKVTREELTSTHHPGTYVFSTQPDTDPLEQEEESPIIVARFYKGTRGRNPRRNFSPHEFLLSQFTGRQAESRLNEEVAEAARAELSSLRHLELRPEVLRQYSALGSFELGEHGENFAAVAWQLLEDAKSEDREKGHLRLMMEELERVERNLKRTSEGGKEDDSDQLAALEGQRDGLQRIISATRPLRTEASGRLKAISSWLSELTPQTIRAIDLQRAPTGEAIFALQEDNYPTITSARSLSDGTLRFAALAFAAIATRGRQTLVIEELENGINPARLALLVKMLEQTAEASRDVQIIASTHSPSVLDFASQETVKGSTVVGWDEEQQCSHPINVRQLPAFGEILEDHTLGALQAEGWLQLAADA